MTGNNTLDRIQKEIKETLQREDELRSKYEKLHNSNSNGKIIDTNGNDNVSETTTTDAVQLQTNGTSTIPKLNGWRRFTPNTTKRGVMQKFLKMRGRVSQPTMASKGAPTNGWTFDQPARISMEQGRPPRNGFVPAEEKMRRELNEFQKREEELRQERRKSQPDLMASLQMEEQNEFGFANNGLKSAKSMANLYISGNDDGKDEIDFRESYSSAPCSLKPARSLAALCDVSDDELEMPGTYSLIMQFEKMKSQQAQT